MKQDENVGAILVVTPKEDAVRALRSALIRQYGRIVSAGTVAEAKRVLAREPVAVLVILTPLGDETEIQTLFDMALRRLTSCIYVVGREIFHEAVYRQEGTEIYVCSYPLQMEQMVQTVSLLHRLRRIRMEDHREIERLNRKLEEEKSVSRLKCLLVGQKNMTEDEAHHYIEKYAMDHGLSRMRAAEQIERAMRPGS